MTVVTLRPDGTISNTGIVLGAATAHAALSDDSDASYLEFGGPSGSVQLNLGDFTLPAGAVVQGVAARIRQSYLEGGGGSGGSGVPTPGWTVLVVSPTTIDAALSATTSPLTISTTPVAAALSEATVDAFTVTVRAKDSDHYLYAVYLDVTYVAKPVVVVDAPTGTVTNTNQPTITWTPTLDAAGGPQTFAAVYIFTAAQYGIGGFDPGTSPRTATVYRSDGVLSAVCPAILPNATYRAYVLSGQTVNGAPHNSSWAFSQFTINVAPPAVPTLTTTAQNTTAANRVQVASNAGTATTDALEVERSLDGGTTWVPLRHTGGQVARIAATSADLYDYEAPNGTAVTYRARSLHNYSGVYAASAWVTSAVTWTSSKWWLKHPNKPGLNVALEMVTYGPVSRAARQGVFQGLGATAPVVVADTRGGATGTSTVRTRTIAARDLLQALLNTGATLLLHGPTSHGEPMRYVRIGDETVTRIIDNANFPLHEIPLAWIEVAKPTGATDGTTPTASP